MTQLAIFAAATTASLLPAWPESKRARHNPWAPDLSPSSASRTAMARPWHAAQPDTTRTGSICATFQLTLERYATITDHDRRGTER
jgi:hypothetical protein